MKQESEVEEGDESTAVNLTDSGDLRSVPAGTAAVLSLAYLAFLVVGGVVILFVLNRAGLLPRESPYTAATRAHSSDLNRGLLSYSLITFWAVLLVLPMMRLVRRLGAVDGAGCWARVPGFALSPALVRPTLQAGIAGLAAVVVGAALAGARPVAGFQAVNFEPWFRLLLFLVVAAALEEVVFRGFLLRLWELAAGSRVSLAMTSLIFALLHSGNPSAAPLALLNTVLAGIVLGLLALRSGSLWPALSLHFVWNAAQGPLLGLPVSGLPANGLAVLPMAPGTGLLAGGSYGFEGGLSATLVLVVGCVFLNRSDRVRSVSMAGGSSPSEP